MNNKDASIIAQVAGKIAATLFQGTGDVTGYQAAVEFVHTDLLARQGRGVDVVTSTVPDTVATAFPNATTVTTAPAATDTDALWNDILTNPENWWNNTGDGDTTVSGGKRPDFRHKTLKDDQGRQKGMFMVDTRWGKHAPPAVFEYVGVPYPSAQPAAPQAAQPAGVPTPPPVPTPF